MICPSSSRRVANQVGWEACTVNCAVAREQSHRLYIWRLLEPTDFEAFPDSGRRTEYDQRMERLPWAIDFLTGQKQIYACPGACSI